MCWMTMVIMHLVRVFLIGTGQLSPTQITKGQALTTHPFSDHHVSLRRQSPAGVSWRGFCAGVHALPAGFLALVLLVEPLFERRKVVENGGGIHLALAADGFQRVRPRLALAHAQHLVQALTGSFVSVDGAPVQRALDACRL